MRKNSTLDLNCKFEHDYIKDNIPIHNIHHQTSPRSHPLCNRHSDYRLYTTSISPCTLYYAYLIRQMHSKPIPFHFMHRILNVLLIKEYIVDCPLIGGAFRDCYFSCTSGCAKSGQMSVTDLKVVLHCSRWS